MKILKNVLPKSAIIFLIFTVICGVVYTGIVTGIAQLIFPDKANGSIIEVDDKKYGCELLGQKYTDEAHMWGRIMNIDVSTYKDENSKTLMYMSEEKVRDIIEKCTDSRFLGVFGEKKVNVLKVNLMLDGIL